MPLRGREFSISQDTSKVQATTSEKYQPVTKVLMAPEHLQSSSIVPLRHPKSGGMSLFHQHVGGYRELLETNGQTRSWFWGDHVISDGSMTISCPLNPIFLAIPYLMRNAKTHYLSLDQILIDDQFPLISRLCDNAKLIKSMKLITDFKDISDTVVVFRYNSHKLLVWLENKMGKLKVALIEFGQIHPNIIESEKALVQYTWNVLSDYLPPEVSVSLQNHLKIEIEIKRQKSPDKKKRKLNNGEPLEPTENYFVDNKAGNKKVVELTANQKKLQKAASGTKSLKSFFQKK